MIRCPKCNFEQPPDQYCARCGVNMATYKAPPAPWSRKLTGSGGFYMFLLISLIAASVYMIFNRSTQLNQIETITTASAPSVPQPPSAQQPTTTTQQVQEIAANSPPQQPDADALALQVKEAAESLFNKAEQAESSDPTANRPTTTLSVKKARLIAHFLEVPQGVLETLFANTGGGVTGLIPSFSNRLAEAKRSAEGRLQVLSKLERTLDGPGTPIRFDQILSETTGIFIRILPTNIADSQVNLETHIEYRSPNAQGAIAIQEFDGIFNVPNAAAVYFADVLPRNPTLRPEEVNLYSRHPVFKVLTSPAYTSNSSEFLIFFEIEGLSE